MLKRLSPSNNDHGHYRPRVIVHCVRSTVGGIFRHISDLIKHQSASGHHVGLICDSLTGGAFEAERLAALRPYLSLGVVQLPMSRKVSLTDAGVMKTVHRLLNEVDVDVLHCHGAKGGAYGRIAAMWLSRDRRRVGRPGVVTIYSPHGGSLHYNPKSIQGRIYFTLERFLENFTDEFVFVAGFEVEAFIRKIGKLRRPWSIAYNGLAASEFEPIKPSAHAVDFVYAGHMRDLKGVDLFIDAVEIASARSDQPLNVMLIGDGEDRPRYEAEVLRRNLSRCIRFHDPLPIRDVFSLTRNLVVPSRAEAMPYIVLEAVGARVPLLATSVGGIPEIYGPHAHNLLAPGDANLIATAMLDRLQRPEKGRALAAKLRRQIIEKFTVDRMFETIDGVYQRHLTGAVVPSGQQRAGEPGSILAQSD